MTENGTRDTIVVSDNAAGGILLFCIPASDYIAGQILEVSGDLREDDLTGSVA